MENTKADGFGHPLCIPEDARFFKPRNSGAPGASTLSVSKSSHSEDYRFLWLRTFNHPVSVRLERKAGGQWLLVVKMANGEAGLRLGSLVQNESHVLGNSDVEPFLALVKSENFWNAPNPVDDQNGTDGSQWILEGVKNGRYHIVDRWSPEHGVARVLGEYLAFRLAHLQITPRDVY